MAQQNVSFTVATLSIAPDREALLFNDGRCEVQHPLFDLPEGGPTLPHYTYSKEQMREARNWLNKPEIVQILEQE